MQPTEALATADSPAPEAQQFDLGQWLGRHQALACLASFSSAADAHALLTIREQKLYRTLGLTWEEFCPRYAGMSKATANRIIENLKEFGDTYFKLSEILKIPAPGYRTLQTAIEDETIEFDGRRIPINRENTAQLIEAVQALSGRLKTEQEKAGPHPLLVLQTQLDRMVGQISGVFQRCNPKDRDILTFMVEDFLDRALEAARRALGATDLDVGEPDGEEAA